METNFNTMPIRTPSDIRKEFKRVRHKAERPLYYLLMIINVLIICALVFVPDMSTGILTAGGSSEAEMQEIADMGISFGPVFIIIMVVAIICAFYQQYAKDLAYAVKVTPTNFPELYETSVEYAKTLGLKKVPEVYVTQENGTLNAFASWVIGRRYVQLNAEIVDIAYMENKDFDVVNFVMAHEFGHVYMHHVTLAYNLSLLFGKALPILGPLLSRAQEYSADRVAQILTQQTGTNCMAMLSVGRHLYAHIDPDDYLKNIGSKRNALERLARFIVNLLATHPIAPFRMAAIMDPNKKSGRLI